MAENTTTSSSDAVAQMPTGEPRLQMRGINKSFGAVRALSDVDFEVYDGEVVGLVGDNGAGKSTLIKTIAGVGPADSGELQSIVHRQRQAWASRRCTKISLFAIISMLSLISS